nr:hypothetical protein [Chitinimonas sp. BJB300]
MTDNGSQFTDRFTSKTQTPSGRISELVKQTRFASAAELATAQRDYLIAYNHHIP